MKSQHGWGSKKQTDSNQKSEIDSQLSQFALQHPLIMMNAASTGGGRRGLSKIYLKTESSGFLLDHGELYGSMVSGSHSEQKPSSQE